MNENMVETQNIEFKESWHDEYLKTICGFANASGGCLEIGRADKGNIVGLTQAKKLMEDLPNKIKNTMAIIADIALYKKANKEYISIKIGNYPFPISYRGVYYIRSGSTTQELTGNALDEFILRKQGKTWDGVPVPFVKVDDLEKDAFRFFRKKALDSQRLSKEDLEIDDATLLQNLTLIENNYIKRAAILLFHQNPEYWIPGAYIKIGYFETGADLIYQDDIKGPLISMPDRAIETIYLKYLKGIISYKGLQRIDSYIVARSALREALLNAVVHKDYSTGVPIQIKVFPDKVIVFNTGGLPESWTIDTLLSPHSSIQRNPFIAEGFFRSGMIEAWGRGIEKIMIACKEYENPLPIFTSNKSGTDITFTNNPKYKNDICSIINDENVGDNVGNSVGDNVGNSVGENVGNSVGDNVGNNVGDNVGNSVGDNVGNSVGDNVGVNDIQRKILEMISEQPNIKTQSIAEALNKNKRSIERNIKSLKESGMLKRIGSTRNGQWIINNLLLKE